MKLDDQLKPTRVAQGYDFIAAAGGASVLARRNGVLRMAGAGPAPSLRP